MYTGRNFPIGRDHLTRDQKHSLCGVPFTNLAFPKKPVEALNRDETCTLCLARLDDVERNAIEKSLSDTAH